MKLRVILDGARDPRINMAIDEAILKMREATGVDTLRIYTWLPTGITIGRSQDALKAVNMVEARRRGYPVVRRPTGGRALLHSATGEVTYSIVLSSASPLYNIDVATSAARIAGGVAEAVKILGLDAKVGGYRGLSKAELCYLTEGSSDVTVEGVKISGSAQVRTRNALLQHGTLLLDFNPEEWATVIKTTMAPGELASRVAGLRQLGLDPRIGEVYKALVEGFRKVLGAMVYTGGLTLGEVQEAYKLYKHKYMSKEWLLQGHIYGKPV
ncbi:MAG: lipoate--protein ligase family protein [Desulfurococcales archaeon]|nr:lipoate--protein ligase family protein [Desulfurococcales archaeon]